MFRAIIFGKSLKDFSSTANNIADRFIFLAIEMVKIRIKNPWKKRILNNAIIKLTVADIFRVWT
jgi:hypothetical protein